MCEITTPGVIQLSEKPLSGLSQQECPGPSDNWTTGIDPYSTGQPASGSAEASQAGALETILPSTKP